MSLEDNIDFVKWCYTQKNDLMEGLFEIYNEDIPIEDKIKKDFEYVKSKVDLRKF